MPGVTWDCTCGATNAGNAAACRECGRTPPLDLAPVPDWLDRWTPAVGDGERMPAAPYGDGVEISPPPGVADGPPPVPTAPLFADASPVEVPVETTFAPPERRPRPRPKFFDPEPEPEPVAPPPPRRRRRMSLGLVVVALVMVAALAVVVDVVLHNGPTPPPAGTAQDGAVPASAH